MNTPDSGSIYIDGKKEYIRSHVDAKRKGIAYVSENRRDYGLVQEQSIENNIIITTVSQYLNKLRLLDGARLEKDVKKHIKDLEIKVSDTQARVNTLSGGNQQKVVLAKWLATNPRLLILDEPTVGIDVIARVIYISL